MKSSKKLAIIGAGSLGIMTLDAVLNEGNYTKEEIVFIDDGKKKDEFLYDIPVIGGLETIINLDPSEYDFVIAVANNKVRKKIGEAYDIPYVTVIHPHAAVSKLSKIGSGNIILPNVTIDPEAIIHNHVIINKNTSIGHNVEMENYSQVSPGAQLGGLIQEGAFIGLGGTVLPNMKVGSFTVIGAGAVVTTNIPSNCLAVGIPAKIKK